VLPVRTPCGHIYCTACLHKTLVSQPERTCPCCRTDLAAGEWYKLFRTHAGDKITFVDRPLAVRCEQIRAARDSKFFLVLFFIFYKIF
jgi:hypothetical protein